MSTALDEQVSQNNPQLGRKPATQLTPAQKQAIVAACAQPGAHKGNIAKEYNVRPEVISRILKAVKEVQMESNPLAKGWKERAVDTAQSVVMEAMTAKQQRDRDIYAAGNIALKVLYGSDVLSANSKVQHEGNVGLTVSWQPVSYPDHGPQHVVIEARNVTPITDDSTQLIDNKE